MRVIRTGLYSLTAFNMLEVFIDTCWRLDNWMPQPRLPSQHHLEKIVPRYLYELIGKIEVKQDNDNEVVFTNCDFNSQRYLNDELKETDTNIMHDMAMSMLKYAGYEAEHAPESKTLKIAWSYSYRYTDSHRDKVDLTEFICTALLILKADIPSWIPASLTEKIAGQPLNPVDYESILVLEEEKRKLQEKLDNDANAEKARYEANLKRMKLEYDISIEKLDRQIAAIRLKADAV
jgi:hypothetical protein